MWWKGLMAIAVAVSLSLPASTAVDAAPAKAAPAKAKRKVPKGHGFLPGYRTPEQIKRAERGREPRYWSSSNGYYWHRGYGYGRPGVYRGRWNGGSFGPCWKQTPIGPMWICG